MAPNGLVGGEAGDAPAPHLPSFRSNPKSYKISPSKTQILHRNHCTTKSIHASQVEPQGDLLERNRNNPVQLKQEDSCKDLASSVVKDPSPPRHGEEEDSSSSLSSDCVDPKECIKKFRFYPHQDAQASVNPARNSAPASNTSADPSKSSSSAEAQVCRSHRRCSPWQKNSTCDWRGMGGSGKAQNVVLAKRSWANVVRGPAADGVVDPDPSEESHENLPWVPAGGIKSSRPPSMHHAQSERSLAFKIWARGRCYRCLEHDHKVRSCKNSFRCIRCHRPGHRERHCHLQAMADIASSFQTKQSIEKVANSVCPASHDSACVDPSSMVKCLLESMRSEMVQVFDAHLKQALQPIREELNIIKQWLARVTTNLDCHEQGKGNVSILSTPELYGPYSPVRLPSASTDLDSLAAAYTSVAPMSYEHKTVDWADSVAKPKASVVDDELVINSTTSEILRHDSIDETVKVLSKASTAQMHLVSPEEQVSLQSTSQVNEFARPQDASHDELMKVKHSVGDSPAKITELLTYDSSSPEVTMAMRVENFAIPTFPTTTTTSRRQPFAKSSFRRRTRSTPHNTLKDMGFIRKNGKLDIAKLNVFADVLKELLPQELLMSLTKLEGRVFWEVLAKILDQLL